MGKTTPDSSSVAVVRTPVQISDEVTKEIAGHIKRITGRDYSIQVELDNKINGAVIYLDGGIKINVDLDANLECLESELADLAEKQAFQLTDMAAAAREATRDYSPAPSVGITETELREMLLKAESGDIVLETKMQLDTAVIDQLNADLSDAAGRAISVHQHINSKLDTSGRLLIGRGAQVDLDVRKSLVDEVENQLDNLTLPKDIGLGPLSENIEAMINKVEPRLAVVDRSMHGTVTEVGDGIAMVSGLNRIGSMEVVKFQSGQRGLAFNLLKDSVGCLILGPEETIKEGHSVERTWTLLEVPVGEPLLGRIVNAIGEPIDEAGPIETRDFLPVERIAPGIVKRRPVDLSLHTGTKVIDALVPLGRGQRELILGDRKIGKTTLAVDTILSQKDTGVICIYTAISQKASSIARVVQVLTEAGAMEYTIVVASLSDEPPAFRYLAPYTATAMAEYFMDKGGNALVIYDDLTKHAATYREISSLFKRPSGREAYPGDIFYIHSRLLERAASMREDLGGGTLTALPIVETLAGDISAFIPTNVISICDGQIFLETGLFNEGFRPAMDVGLSVSRVGGMAQTPAMKSVAGRLRIDLAQYHEMAQFVKFGAEVDQTTLDQLARGERAREVLKQDQHKPMPLEHEIAILFAVVNGYLDDIPADKVSEFESGFSAYLDESHPALMKDIRQQREMTESSKEEFVTALTDYKQTENICLAEADGNQTTD
jgi:F-type H+-transporting ATPase subunit alpha